MKDPNPSQTEFSRLIAVEQISTQETVREIAANPSERARLAERFDLLALDRLQATLRIQRVAGGLVRIRGHFEADVTESCVATLEPVLAHWSEDFAISFGPGRQDQNHEVEISIDEEEPPEEIVDGRIDLGETVAQQLAVSLDPYPRSELAPPAVGAGLGEAGDLARKTGPFSALKSWRDRKGGR
ncbi:MAG: YceD family protein [Dongiaceae bacterium]